VVFTGSVDQCTGAAAARDIRDDIKRSGVHATFKFVGLKLGNKSRERLLTFEKALGQRAADIAFATTTSDLAAVKGWLRQDTGRTSDCADEVDNDGDGEVDDEDPQCASGGTQEAARRSGECADQTDNDGDGKVDDEDPQCASGGTQEAARRSGRLPRR